jgi:hypothetical protein
MGCRCHCHNWLRGTQRAAYDAENYMTAFQYSQRARVWEDIMENGVHPADPLEAAMACKKCIDAHTPALSGPPPPLRPPPFRAQADGWTDPPREGSE